MLAIAYLLNLSFAFTFIAIAVAAASFVSLASALGRRKDGRWPWWLAAGVVGCSTVLVVLACVLAQLSLTDPRAQLAFFASTVAMAGSILLLGIVSGFVILVSLRRADRLKQTGFGRDGRRLGLVSRKILVLCFSGIVAVVFIIVFLLIISQPNPSAVAVLVVLIVLGLVSILLTAVLAWYFYLPPAVFGVSQTRKSSSGSPSSEYLSSNQRQPTPSDGVNDLETAWTETESPI